MRRSRGMAVVAYFSWCFLARCLSSCSLSRGAGNEQGAGEDVARVNPLWRDYNEKLLGAAVVREYL